MAHIFSRTSLNRIRKDMNGSLDDYLGVTFRFVDGRAILHLAMTAKDGRKWYLGLDADETEKLFAGCDKIRTLNRTTAI